jgi:RNA polymerase sigma factor (sigma-70 family)
MSSSAGDEAETWQRALSGDGGAFAALFREHQARVYRRALSLVGDVHDADDVTAAAFFELWRKRRSVRLVEGGVLPWLLVTTINMARNHRRGALRYRRLISSLPHGETQNAETVAVANLEAEALGVRLSKALSRVTKADAALLVLTALDGLSITDAAQTLGIKPGTARMRLQRARHRLQADLAFEPRIEALSIIEGERA